jgi:hypothetical protein
VTAHNHTELVRGCFRCDLNIDELKAQWKEIDEEVQELKRQLEIRIKSAEHAFNLLDPPKEDYYAGKIVGLKYALNALDEIL